MIDIQAKLIPAIDDANHVMQAAYALLKTADVLSIPVITTEHYPEKIGGTALQLIPYQGEVISKTTFSAMREPAFFKTLQKISEAGHRRKLLFFGCEAHVCVLQSVLEAQALGDYQCYLVTDACGSRKASDKAVALARAEKVGVSLLTTEMVLFECLESGEHPHFKEVMSLVKGLKHEYSSA